MRTGKKKILDFVVSKSVHMFLKNEKGNGN